MTFGKFGRDSMPERMEPSQCGPGCLDLPFILSESSSDSDSDSWFPFARE